MLMWEQQLAASTAGPLAVLEALHVRSEINDVSMYTIGTLSDRGCWTMYSRISESVIAPDDGAEIGSRKDTQQRRNWYCGVNFSVLELLLMHKHRIDFGTFGSQKRDRRLEDHWFGAEDSFQIQPCYASCSMPTGVAAVSLSIQFPMEPSRRQTSLLRIAKSNTNSSVLILPVGHDELVLDAQGAELGGLPRWQDGCARC